MKGLLQDRGNHPAGHVQFFNKTDFFGLLSESGLEVDDHYVYAPSSSLDTIKFADAGVNHLKVLLKMCTEHYLPRNIASYRIKFYHAHMGVLSQNKSR
ncbi:MAG: hypothetical protein OXF06_01200, partial [Bacteroidetes bacterium]|nr:hypothetical protein [Bacteroidota bacterium]